MTNQARKKKRARVPLCQKVSKVDDSEEIKLYKARHMVRHSAAIRSQTSGEEQRLELQHGGHCQSLPAVKEARRPQKQQAV